MGTYVVTKVRTGPASDDRHLHLDGVVTAAGVYYSAADVAASIRAGDTWRVSAAGHSATIQLVDRCPRAGCTASSYLATDPEADWDPLVLLPEG